MSSIVSLGLSNSYIAPLWLTELLLMTINSQLTEDKNIKSSLAMGIHRVPTNDMPAGG